MFKKLVLLVITGLIAVTAFAGVKTASADAISISTDRSTYFAGQQIKICYTLPSMGWVVIRLNPERHTTLLMEGYVAGAGSGCFSITATQTGEQCLHLHLGGPFGPDATTCFRVLLPLTQP
jgi:hypothetical protein